MPVHHDKIYHRKDITCSWFLYYDSQQLITIRTTVIDPNLSVLDSENISMIICFVEQPVFSLSFSKGVRPETSVLQNGTESVVSLQTQECGMYYFSSWALNGSLERRPARSILLFRKMWRDVAMLQLGIYLSLRKDAVRSSQVSVQVEPSIVYFGATCVQTR